SSGGYSFQLSPGTYTVTASGGGLSAPITKTVTVGATNYRLNFINGTGSGGGSGSASFVKSDPATQGNWVGTYGADGYNVINYATSYPSYASVTPSGQSSYTW